MLGPDPGGVFETCLKAIFDGLSRFPVKACALCLWLFLRQVLVCV